MRSTIPWNNTPRAAFWLRWILCICSVTASWTVLEPMPAHARPVLRGVPRSCCAGKACACVPQACPCMKPGPLGSPAPAPEPAQPAPAAGGAVCVRDIVRLPAVASVSGAECVRPHPGSAPPARAGTLLDLFGCYLI